jgi:hypothetical protein
LRFGDHAVIAPKPLSLRQWYKIEVSIGNHCGLTISATTFKQGAATKRISTASTPLSEPYRLNLDGIVSVGAKISSDSAGQFFNGKIENPQIWADGILI